MRECTNKRFVIVKRIIKSIIIYLHINLSFVLFSLNLRLVHHRTR